MGFPVKLGGLGFGLAGVGGGPQILHQWVDGSAVWTRGPVWAPPVPVPTNQQVIAGLLDVNCFAPGTWLIGGSVTVTLNGIATTNGVYGDIWLINSATLVISNPSVGFVCGNFSLNQRATLTVAAITGTLRCKAIGIYGNNTVTFLADVITDNFSIITSNLGGGGRISAGEVTINCGSGEFRMGPVAVVTFTATTLSAANITFAGTLNLSIGTTRSTMNASVEVRITTTCAVMVDVDNTTAYGADVNKVNGVGGVLTILGTVDPNWLGDSPATSYTVFTAAGGVTSNDLNDKTIGGLKYKTTISPDGLQLLWLRPGNIAGVVANTGAGLNPVNDINVILSDANGAQFTAVTDNLGNFALGGNPNDASTWDLAPGDANINFTNLPAGTKIEGGNSQNITVTANQSTNGGGDYNLILGP